MPAYAFTFICNAPDDATADSWFSGCTDAVSAVPEQQTLTGCSVVGEGHVRVSDAALS